MMNLKIGALARQTGTNAPTIRYYEDIGLLPVADRASGGQRVYGESDLKRLIFIRRCREFDFSIEQIRMLLDVVKNPKSSCAQARDIAKHQLDALRKKLVELKALERNIAGFVTNCDASCAGGPGPDCVIWDDLSAHPPNGRSQINSDTRCC